MLYIYIFIFIHQPVKKLATKIANVYCDRLLLAHSSNFIILTFVFVRHKIFWRDSFAPPHPLHPEQLPPALFEQFTGTNYAKRAFRCSAPAVSNSLPRTVLDCDTMSTFKSKLSTFLFSHTFTNN